MAPTPAPSIVDWIIRKRDGGELEPEQIQDLVARFLDGQVTDYQLSAWLMAVFFQGLSLRETVALTQAMLRSGRQLTHPGNSRPKVDKHSTGGVGDKISLCLAPLVAACGAAVPMISGRGLGHTGGTLDKLEAIPGYQVRISAARFQSIVRSAGASIIGQTEELAPADARIYALRDVTGTVASRPLITASILSKKLAAGLDALVMDVKVGAGAFMPDRESARALSQLLSRVGRQLGLPVRGLLTEMASPIGHTIGNALEVREAIAVLQDKGPPVTRELTLALGSEMLRVAGLERQPTAARRRLERALSSGAGAECFARMIALHGGDARVVAEPSRLPRAPAIAAVLAPRAGYVTQIDARALGLLGVWLGAGRTRADQAVDPRVGIELCVQLGSRVEAKEPLAHLHLASRRHAAEAAARALAAFTLSRAQPASRPCVLERWTQARA
ncbi:MAG TPA: thymidine phosphorylase [Polyangiaceae bacterium]|nr:thymidine phosphorylase [Polyangiaceae bacterium]